MEDIRKTSGSIDEYISEFTPEIQEILKKLRSVINETAPEAAEKINYQMPTFTLHGNLVHFAAFKNHIGFYPTPGAITAFSQELSEYQRSKGAIRFPIDRPLPYELIGRMVQYRVEEQKRKAAEKNWNKNQDK